MNNQSDSVISVDNLIKAYGETMAVDGIRFEVLHGEVFGMLGPNGAGKTTTVEIIEGLRTADKGSVSILGADVSKDIGLVKKQIGIQLQEPALFPNLKVYEIINFFRSLYPLPVPSEKLMEMVSLQESRDVLVKNLSGGQQQRLSVSLALVNYPDIIFLDEPTTGLDPQARHAIWDIVDDLSRNGKTVFLTTHNMEEAERLCHRVAIMDHGKIIALGTPKTIIEENLKENALQFRVSGYTSPEELINLSGVTNISEEDGEFTMYTEDIPATISALMTFISARSARLLYLSVRMATLEDVFLKLTGRKIIN